MFIRWAETMLVHGEGDLLGQPYKVPQWLKRAAFRIFEYDPNVVDPTTGTHPFIVRETLIVCPKGSAKTEGIAAVALFLLAGPCMPSPAGPKMRTSPNIPVAAASWDQAAKLFTNAATNMAKGTTDLPSPLSDFVECFDAEIQLKDRPGSLYRVAAVAGTNDGGLPTAGVGDELHEWTGRKARVHLVLFQGLDKRWNGIVFNITTPDDADPESLLGQKIAHGLKLASGEEADPGFYFLWYAAQEGCPLDTPDDVIAAVESAHPAEWISPERIARKLLVDKMPVHEFRRYWLGQFVKAEGHWLPENGYEVKVAADTSWPADGTEVVLAFDGSYRRDSTALIGCTLEGYSFVVKTWERPADAKDTWRVPRSDVAVELHAAMKRWTVVELAPDPPGWHSEIEEWEETYGEVVVRFETNQTKRMASACSRFYSAIVPDENGEEAPIPLSHDGNPTVIRHLSNAVPKNTSSGVVITKESADSPRKIDAAIAAIVAYDRACWHALHRMDTDSAYEDRGLVTL